VITKVRDVIHGLHMIYVARKDCVDASVVSRGRDCGIVVQLEVEGVSHEHDEFCTSVSL